jgi:hypothetical protein
MKGVQDLTVAVKYKALDTPFTDRGSLRAIGVASAGLAASDYTPDGLPLSFGTACRRVSGRLPRHFQATPGGFGRGTGAPSFSLDVARRIGRLVVTNPDVAIFPPETGRPEADVRRKFAVAVRDEVARRRRRTGTVTFDDLLTRLRDTLLDPVRGDIAVERLRSRYRACRVACRRRLRCAVRYTAPARLTDSRRCSGAHWRQKRRPRSHREQARS